MGAQREKDRCECVCCFQLGCLYNSLVSSGKYPISMKTGDVKPLHEDGTHNDAQIQQRGNQDKGCKDGMVGKTKANTNQAVCMERRKG